MAHVPLSKKYSIARHMDNLKRRYGPEIMQCNGINLESEISPEDPDLAPILAFRAECKNNDRKRVRHQTTHARTIVEQNHNEIMQEMMHGRSIPFIAEWLEITSSALKYHIMHDHELAVVYRMTRPRRDGIPDFKFQELNEMLEMQYPHAYIAKKLGLTLNQVNYQSQKRNRLGDLSWLS